MPTTVSRVIIDNVAYPCLLPLQPNGLPFPNTPGGVQPDPGADYQADSYTIGDYRYPAIVLLGADGLPLASLGGEGGGGGTPPSDEAFGPAWDGITSTAPSKNAVYDKIAAIDSQIAGLAVSDEAYGPTWNGATAAPTKNAVFDKLNAMLDDLAYNATTWNGDVSAPSKNAVRDKIESMIDDTAYDATSWDGVTTVSPSKNAVRDKIAAMDALITAATPSDVAYDATTWNGSLIPPTKNAVRDKIESMISDAAFGAGWNGDLAAPTKNAVYDKVSVMVDNTAYGAGWAAITDVAPSKAAVYAQIEAMMTVTAPIVLLTNRTTDGSPGGVDWGGGPGLITVYGNWDSGTTSVQIAYSPDGGTTYINADQALIQGANASILVEFPAGKVRATVANAGAGTNLSSKLESTR